MTLLIGLEVKLINNNVHLLRHATSMSNSHSQN